MEQEAAPTPPTASQGRAVSVFPVQAQRPQLGISAVTQWGRDSHTNDCHHLPASPLVARRFEVLVSASASQGFALNTVRELAGAE